jgi:hypothetical protein
MNIRCHFLWWWTSRSRLDHREGPESNEDLLPAWDFALTYDHAGAVGTWVPSELPPGQALRQAAPLFKKLDESLIDEECARLEG